MKSFRFVMCLLPLAGLLLAGCGKKNGESSAPAPDAGAEAAKAAAAATPPPAAQPQPAPVNHGAEAALRDAQQAAQARDYDKAAQMMLQLQHQQQLNAQQAAAVQNQMRQFQANLAQAAANGDPKAQAAAERLRRASMVR